MSPTCSQECLPTVYNCVFDRVFVCVILCLTRCLIFSLTLAPSMAHSADSVAQSIMSQSMVSRAQATGNCQLLRALTVPVEDLSAAAGSVWQRFGRGHRREGVCTIRRV